jgi:hypothetical protein
VLTNPDDISVAVTSGILFSTTASLVSLFAPKLHLTLTKGAIVKALNSKLGMSAYNVLAANLTFYVQKNSSAILRGSESSAVSSEMMVPQLIQVAEVRHPRLLLPQLEQQTQTQ